VNPYVDGGLCENLPVEGLLADAHNAGDVFAVTPQVEQQPFNQVGLLAYLMRLFDVSIDNSVKRSKAFLPSNNVIEVGTNLGTFDFDAALNQLYGSVSYSLIYKNTSEQIKQYIAAFKTNQHRSPTIHDYRTELSTVKKSIAAVYKSAFSDADLTVLRTSLIVYGDSLDESKSQKERRPDLIRREVVYRLGADPIHCISVHMASDGNTISSRPLRHSVVRLASGQTLESHLVAVEDESTLSLPERRQIQCLIFLDHPVRATPDQNEIEVRWDYQVADCMAPLFQRGYDELSIFNPRVHPTPLIDIILLVPNTFRGTVRCSDLGNSGATTARQMSANEIMSTYRGLDTVNYTPIGARAENLLPEQRFVVGFSSQSNVQTYEKLHLGNEPRR
jgi:hypothetical protein